jgi:prevent-host-death family protein
MVINRGHMAASVSKSKFKARALELFREVERTGQPVVITDRGVPVLKVVPFRDDPATALRALRQTVVKYEAPTEPVGDADWEADE